MTDLVTAALRAGNAAYPRLRIDPETLAAFLADRVVAKEMQSLLKLIRSQLLVSARTIFRSSP